MAFKTLPARNGTALRTFRLPNGLISTLETEAKNRGISVNALVSSLIAKFDNWDKFADRFHFIAITDDLLKVILDNLADEEVVAIANTVGVRLAEEAMTFWYKGASVDSLVMYLTNRCRYAGYGSIEYQKNGNDHFIAIHHTLGGKWSTFLRHVIVTVLKLKFGIVGRPEVSDTLVVVHFNS